MRNEPHEYEKLKKMNKFVIFLLAIFCITEAEAQVHIENGWTGTWAAAPQPVVKNFMPFNNDLTRRSVRQVVRVSIGGNVVRLKLSNKYSFEPVVISSVYIAPTTEEYRISPKQAKYLSFGRHRGVFIRPGSEVYSDALHFKIEPLQRLSITINYAKAPNEPTVHMGSRTTSYIVHGSSNPFTTFWHAFREDHWFNISALEVYTREPSAVAILGNSITDGKNSTTNKQNRWPDIMANYLPGVGVLNLGIGANCVLSTFIGTPGKERFAHDILGQRGLKAIIIFEGTNDLGRCRDGMAMARKLVETYREFIKLSHMRHIKILGATIMPVKGCIYFTPSHERGRQWLNQWIRKSGEFDGVIDFDELMHDPKNPLRLRPEWQSDWLHPNAEGYRVMGEYAAKKMKEFFRR